MLIREFLARAHLFPDPDPAGGGAGVQPPPEKKPETSPAEKKPETQHKASAALVDDVAGQKKSLTEVREFLGLDAKKDAAAATAEIDWAPFDDDAKKADATFGSFA